MSSSPAPLALAKRGSPAHSLTKPAVMASTPATLDCLVSSRNSPFAKADGRYPKLLREYAKPDLLILDDWGLINLNDDSRRDLLEILDDRHNRKSTLVTSQLPPDKWHDYIGEPTLADAILDRLVHTAYKINLKGESMRKNNPDLTTDTTNK